MKFISIRKILTVTLMLSLSLIITPQSPLYADSITDTCTKIVMDPVNDTIGGGGGGAGGTAPIYTLVKVCQEVTEIVDGQTIIKAICKMVRQMVCED